MGILLNALLVLVRQILVFACVSAEICRRF